jgi:anaerobic dimethyl sulfoxide reductase subunit A
MSDNQSKSKKKIITSTCSYDCGGRCLLEVRVSDNRITGIKSGNAGDLHIDACPRGLAQKEVIYSPDRLKTPLMRIGERGSREFKPISWEEAFSAIAGKFKDIIKKHQTESIYFIGGSGSESTLNDSRGIVNRFFGMLGRCTSVWGGASLEAAIQSSLATFGTIETGGTRDNILHSKYIILWGWDPLITRFGSDTGYYLKKARDAGVKIISVDPRKNKSAKELSRKWVPIRPGTDAAMLIAMAHVMISEGIYDRDFVKKYTYGFNHFHDYVMGKEDRIPKNPEWAESISGVPARDIREIARDYASMHPAALMTGWAPGRSAYGEQFQRAASVLAAMTGNIGIKGGFASGGTDILDIGRMDQKLPGPRTNHKKIHNTELYDSLINEGIGEKVSKCRILYMIGANVLNQYLNLNKGIEAFKKPELIVVHELFMTPTARFADIVLPVKHYMELEDLGFPWIGGKYSMMMNRVVKAEMDVRSDLEILTEISDRIGMEGFNDLGEKEWFKKMLNSYPGLPGIEQLKNERFIKLDYKYPRAAFSEQIKDIDKNPFSTPSGKIEIFSNMFNDRKDPFIPPIPKYIPAWEGHEAKLAEKYPLQLITPHARLRINSQLDNIKKLKSGREDLLWINPHDAEERGIKHGDIVIVFNSRGKIRVIANVTDRILKKTVSLDEGKWYNPDGKGIDSGGNANVLSLDRMSPTGAFTSNTCLVQIEKK